MRELRPLLALIVCAPLVLGATPVSQNWDAVEIRVVPVAEGVYMLQGPGGNIGLSVGDDGAFVIDDQFAPITDKIRAAIATVTDSDVRFVVNTHYHGDHTGGNENFGEGGALLVAHENVRRRMNPAEFTDIIGNSQQAPPAALPVVTFTDAVTFHWNGETISVEKVDSSHTDGDSVVFFRNADVVHMGDTFFAGVYPFIDVDSGGNARGMVAALRGVVDRIGPQTHVIPGHGGLSTRADIVESVEMLEVAIERVSELMERDMSLEEIVAAAPLADYDEAWSWNFVTQDRFLRALFVSLGGTE